MSEHQQTIDLLAMILSAQQDTNEAITKLIEAIAATGKKTPEGKARTEAATAIKKAKAEPAADPVINADPLPEPATPPAQVASSTVEADVDRVRALIPKLPRGAEQVKELTAKHGKKFHELDAKVRAEILKALDASAAEATK